MAGAQKRTCEMIRRKRPLPCYRSMSPWAENAVRRDPPKRSSIRDPYIAAPRSVAMDTVPEDFPDTFLRVKSSMIYAVLEPLRTSRCDRVKQARYAGRFPRLNGWHPIQNPIRCTTFQIKHSPKGRDAQPGRGNIYVSVPALNSQFYRIRQGLSIYRLERDSSVTNPSPERTRGLNMRVNANIATSVLANSDQLSRDQAKR
jgi:hypothetical protein